MGTGRRATDRTWPSSFRVALCDRIRRAGERPTVWNVANAVCKEMFELILADFAKSVGAGANKRIVLQIDNAGWHGPENLSVPDGIRLVFQPAHSPELQPAEHLRAFIPTAPSGAIVLEAVKA